jgi:prevent-host-death family protein
MDRIGVRELRQHASRYLSRVAKGESLEVTDRGRPIALLVPVPHDRWEEMIERGQIVVASDETSVLSDAPLVVDFDASGELAAMRDEER